MKPLLLIFIIVGLVGNLELLPSALALIVMTALLLRMKHVFLVSVVLSTLAKDIFISIKHEGCQKQ